MRITLVGGAEARVLEFGLETVPGLIIRAGDAGICTVPVNRKGESLDEQPAALSWTPASGALAYEVGYRLAAGGPLTRVLTPSPGLDLVGLSANTLYSWAVRSLCAADPTAISAGLIFGTSDLPRVSSSTTITAASPGFPPLEPDGLGAFGGLGAALAALGDLNGDGIPDLVVGAEQDEDPLTLAGSVWLIALQDDGTLLSSRKLADGQNGLSLGLQTDDRFGQGLAWIRDSDGDGLPELLVGAPRADVPGSNMGAVHRLNLDAPAPCPPPADAAVDSVLSTAVLLDWSAVPEATAYEIEGRRLGVLRRPRCEPEPASSGLG